MFSLSPKTFTQSYGVIGSTTLNSTCGDYIHLNPMSREVTVLYRNGSVYTYKNVSLRSIWKFIIDESRSFGKFVNNVLKTDRVKVYPWTKVLCG